MLIYHKALLLPTSVNPVNCAFARSMLAFSLTKSFKKIHLKLNYNLTILFGFY